MHIHLEFKLNKDQIETEVVKIAFSVSDEEIVKSEQTIWRGAEVSKELYASLS